jgi:hypothetical protein
MSSKKKKEKADEFNKESDNYKNAVRDLLMETKEKRKEEQGKYKISFQYNPTKKHMTVHQYFTLENV